MNEDLPSYPLSLPEDDLPIRAGNQGYYNLDTLDPFNQGKQTEQAPSESS